MNRTRFLAGASALVLLRPSPAWATGGLEDDPDFDAPRTPRSEVGRSEPPGAIRVRVPKNGDAGYRGTLTDFGDTRINTLSVEEYLLGVVPLEMPSAWPQAALEAQAVVARTYALRRRNGSRPYDLVAGTGDQMYGGLSAEKPTGSAAVMATSDTIVTYTPPGRSEKSLANVAYMSCCGGHTADSELLWGFDIPYLHGVADPYCAAAPSSSWSIALDWRGLARSLGLGDGATLRSVSLIGSPGARPSALRLVADTSQDIEIRELRRLARPQLPSAYLRSVDLRGAGEERTLVVNGSGHGHGVGLCQWGARGMALAGATTAQIIAFYFPGTSLGLNRSL